MMGLFGSKSSGSDFQFKWYGEEKAYKLVKYSGKGTDVVIPSEHDGLPVGAIAEEAFLKCKNIRTVKVPNSIKTIGIRAFCGCFKLECVDLPESIFELPEEIFVGCSSLTELHVPKSVRLIAKNAFQYSEITNIYINSHDCMIEEGAFSDCLSLKNVVFSAENADIKIDDEAFGYSTSLSEESRAKIKQFNPNVNF